MNHTEEKYADHLQDRVLVGEIRWWSYECWKFRLADNTWYSPDFIVVDTALRIEAHEVKSFWKNVGRAGWQEDARVKIKCAAEIHPVRFIAATLNPDQSWSFEEFGKDREEYSPQLPDLSEFIQRHMNGLSTQEMENLMQVIRRWEERRV